MHDSGSEGGVPQNTQKPLSEGGREFASAVAEAGSRSESTDQLVLEVGATYLKQVEKERTFRYKLAHSKLGKKIVLIWQKAKAYTRDQIDTAKSLAELKFIFRELWSVPKHHWILTGILSLVEAGLQAASAVILGILIDHVVSALADPNKMVSLLPFSWSPQMAQTALVDTVAIFLSSMLVFKFLSFNLATYYGKNASIVISTKIAKRTSEKILRADMATHTYRQTGAMLSNFSRGIGFIETYLYQTASTGLLSNLLTMPFILGVMFWENWVIGLITMATLLTAVLVNVYFGVTLSKQEAKIQKDRSKMGQRLYKVVDCMREVIVANKRDDEIALVLADQDSLLPIKMKQSKTWRLLTSSLSVWEYAFLAVLLLIAVRMVYSGSVSVGSIAKYYTWYTLLYLKFMDIQFKYSNSLMQIPTVQQIKELDDFQPSVKEGDVELQIADIDGELRFNNVTAIYQTPSDYGRPGKQVVSLQNASFVLKPQGFNVIVGETGGGKSTTLNLICRLWDPASGLITLDNRSISDYTLYSYRSNIAVLNQDPGLFNDTIRYNVCYGAEWASEAEIIEAAEQAQALEFIQNTPNGFDTMLGERGLNLSGGQRQRVALARAILRSKRGRLVVMDEPTSALDRKTSARFLKDARRVFSNHTVVVVTHLIIEDADHIVVIDKSRVAGEGTHSELLQSCPEYAELTQTAIRTT